MGPTRPNPYFLLTQPALTHVVLKPNSTHPNELHSNTQPIKPISTRPISRLTRRRIFGSDAGSLHPQETKGWRHPLWFPSRAPFASVMGR